MSDICRRIMTMHAKRVESIVDRTIKAPQSKEKSLFWAQPSKVIVLLCIWSPQVLNKPKIALPFILKPSAENHTGAQILKEPWSNLLNYITQWKSVKGPSHRDLRHSKAVKHDYCDCGSWSLLSLSCVLSVIDILLLISMIIIIICMVCLLLFLFLSFIS